MKHIKDYMKKIEKIVAADVKKPKGKGLLSQSQPTDTAPKTEVQLIAEYVKGIRQAREEMING